MEMHLLATSEARHDLTPSEQPQVSQGQIIHLNLLVLKQWHALQEECEKYGSISKLLHPSTFSLCELDFHVNQQFFVPIEHGGRKVVNDVLKLRRCFLLQCLNPIYTGYSM